MGKWCWEYGSDHGCLDLYPPALISGEKWPSWVESQLDSLLCPLLDLPALNFGSPQVSISRCLLDPHLFPR